MEKKVKVHFVVTVRDDNGMFEYFTEDDIRKMPIKEKKSFDTYEDARVYAISLIPDMYKEYLWGPKTIDENGEPIDPDELPEQNEDGTWGYLEGWNEFCHLKESRRMFFFYAGQESDFSGPCCNHILGWGYSIRISLKRIP